MAFWTVIGKGNEGDAQGKAFGITLDTSADKWIANGPSVDLFFTNKSGQYNVGPSGTQLVSPSGNESAFFTNLNGTSPVGATGVGRASEKGVTFSWKLDSK
jgi:hypothetical protein